MPGDHFNRGWLDGNMSRAYPLAPWCSRVDETGTFTLPDDLLVELYFPVGPGVTVDPARFYIKSIAAYATGAAITLGYADGSRNGVAVAAATFPTGPTTRFVPTLLPGVGDFAGSTGKLMIGSTAGLAAQPGGLFNFNPEATQLDPDCVRPQLAGVRGIRVDGVMLDGVVQLALGRNIRLTAPTGDSIRVDAISGAGLVESGGCVGDAPAGTPITSVNGVPSANGAFSIVGDATIDVTADSTGLRLSNPTVSPCCGCPEIDELRDAVSFIMEQLRATRAFQNKLDSQVTRMNSVIIASRVNDGGCVACG